MHKSLCGLFARIARRASSSGGNTARFDETVDEFLTGEDHFAHFSHNENAPGLTIQFTDQSFSCYLRNINESNVAKKEEYTMYVKR